LEQGDEPGSLRPRVTADPKQDGYGAAERDCFDAAPRPVETAESGKVIELPVLGGLHYRYTHKGVTWACPVCPALVLNRGISISGA
jgi:hypothetical protein